MARVQFLGDLPKQNLKEENRIRQGDFIYCQTNQAASFWAIYDTEIGVIALDGASNCYIRDKVVYLGETYSYWTTVKRVPCDKMKVTLEEIK